MSHTETQKVEESELLSKMLMEGSAVVHREAERRPFMVAFFRARLPKDAYSEWLARQHTVYTALEEADDELRDHPVVGVMHSPELHRTQSLERDLDFYIGKDWRERVKPSPAAEAYADRIRWVTQEFPPAFVAHQWLRYLGNVLAQDVLKRLVTKSFGFENEGMEFYDFPEVADSKAYLGQYHARMNSLPIDLETKKQVADEGSRAFQLNIDLTDELAQDFGIAAASSQEAEEILEELTAEHP